MSLKKFLTTFRSGKDGDKAKSKESTFVVERRQHPRIKVELPLDYSIVDPREHQGGMVADASEGGLLAYLRERSGIGTQLNIEILFVKGLALSSIKGIAKVVWLDLAAKEGFGKHRYGLQFESLHESGLDKLKDMLKEIGETYKKG